MKKPVSFIFGILILGLLFFLVVPSQAQEPNPEEIAKQHGITFPIADLGNCGSVSVCRTYCEDPVNQAACLNFAKQKGLDKEVQVSSEEQERMAARARVELGCDSFQSCSSFCSDPTNYDKCHSFAQKHGYSGGRVEDPGKAEILSKAKEVLGCDSPQSCMSLCNDPANREKCSNFAQQVGLRGGEMRSGPGGCTSEQTCQTFCSDPANYQICSGYAQGSGGKFSGPGGCDSEASCRSYCEKNPRECGGFGGPGGSPPPGYNPQEMCSRTPNCAWKDNTCQCGFYGGTGGETQQQSEEYAKFCQQNPDKCGPGGAGGFDSAQKREEFEKFCRENPEKCGGSGGSYTPPPGYTAPSGSTQYNPPPQGGYSTDPATGCSQAGGSWVNGSCQFGGSSGGSSGGYTQPAPDSGGSSGGNYAPPPSEPQPAPPPSDSGGSSGGSAPPPSGVYGASTVRNWLQIISDYLFAR